MPEKLYKYPNDWTRKELVDYIEAEKRLKEGLMSERDEARKQATEVPRLKAEIVVMKEMLQVLYNKLVEELAK